MPGTQNRNEDVFAKYNAMSTEELQQILREDASKPEGQEETSTEALFYIMEVLAQRRRARNEGKTPEEALEAFHKYYEEGEALSKPERKPVTQKNSTTPNWIKRLVAAAAIIILIFSGTITAKAFGFDLWEIIVKWTQETFHFGYISDNTNVGAPDENSAEVFSGLQAALDDYDIKENLVPQWIPTGFTEVDIKIFDTPKQRQFMAKYQLEDKMVKIWIADYLESYPSQIEQSESAFEVYEVSGIKYYIINNEDQVRIAWVVDSFECYISGDLSVEELKKMVDSIEKG